LGKSSADLQSKMLQMISTLTENEARIIEKFMLSAIDTMKEFTTDLKSTIKWQPESRRIRSGYDLVNN
jgi:hypothetical protein